MLWLIFDIVDATQIHKRKLKEGELRNAELKKKWHKLRLMRWHLKILLILSLLRRRYCELMAPLLMSKLRFFMSSSVTYVTDHILSKNLQSRLPFRVVTVRNLGQLVELYFLFLWLSQKGFLIRDKIYIISCWTKKLCAHDCDCSI